MSNLKDTDSFLVSREGVNYSITSENMSELRDTDLLLVSRDGVNYKLEAQDLDLVPPEIPIVSGTITDLGVSPDRFTDEQFKIDISVQEAAKRTDQEVKPYVVATYVSDMDMYGLRFDNSRVTSLQRSGNATVGTVSAWIKPATISTASQFVVAGLGNRAAILINQNLEVSATGTNAIGTLNANQWNHVVVSQDDYQTRGYLNGVETDIKGVGNAPFFDTGFIVGGNASGQTAGQNFDGYLSDVYFVETAVPPSVFGGPVDGVWLPKSYEEVVAELPNYPIQPYDYRANTDQVWSNGTSLIGVSQGNGSIQDIYNGEPTFCQVLGGSNGQGIQLIPPATLTGTTVQVSISNGGNTTSTVKVNGTEYETVATATEKVVTVDLGAATTITSIELVRASGTDGFGAYYIKVDGRLLVDQGVWDVSTWNTQTTYDTSKISASAFAKLFDGVPSDSVQANQGNTDTLTWDSGVIGGNPGDVIRIFFQGNITPVAINGTNRTITQYDWFTVPENYLTSLEVLHPSAGNICNPGAIEVNGEILVDSGAQWNTSQVWSANTTNSWTGSGTAGLKNMFDGSLETYAYSASGSASVEFTGLTANSSIRLYGGLNQATSWKITLGGTEYFINLPSTFSWIDITDASFPVSLDKIENLDATGQIYAVEVDGEILVDAGSFGDNGFYLPFDPAAVNPNSGPSFTYSGSYKGNNSPVVFFADNRADSSRSTVSATDGNKNTTALSYTFTDAPTGTYTLYFGNNHGGTWENSFTVNGVVPPKNDTTELGYPSSFVNKYEFTGKLETIIQRQGVSGTFECVLHNILFEGEAFTPEYSGFIPIGLDASGNGNTFQAKNFGVGDSSQTWSKNLVVPNGLVNSNFSLQNAFNGSFESLGVTTNGPIEFTQDLTVTESLGLVTERVTKATVYDANGNAEFTSPDLGGSAGMFTISRAELTAAGIGQTITKIVLADQPQNPTPNATYLYAVLVDGIKLIDPSFVDTVTDTPLKSYAVLAEGSNGNLVNAPSSTTSMSTIIATSFPIYAEFTVLADADGNNEGITIRDSANTQIHNLQVPDAKAGDLYGIVITETTRQWYKNGATLGGEEALDTSNGIKLGAYNLGSAGKFAANFGQQPWIFTPPDGYEGLFQESINSGSSGGSGSSPSGSYASGRLYLVLDGSGNVTDMQSEDPGYIVLGNTKEYTITWPALLPSGESPDTELPEGTQICAYVKATNDSGFDEELTNHLTPS